MSAALILLALLLILPAWAHGGDDAELEVGRQVFLELAEPSCGICHRLADAGTTGTIAPDLDRLRPAEDQVRSALLEGPGAMPDYSERLTQDEIDAVSRYVAEVAGQAN